ncbi:MAG: hypothetical protein FVQ85_20195 [Planctomycetes bacterium]|nr:hypothetical protein [Planctomycetota bacterium]
MIKFIISIIIIICVVTCLLLFLLFLSFTPSCRIVKDQSRLSGTYVADYEFAKEKLTIKSDGTFIQEVTLKASSKVDIAKGTWTYKPRNGYFRFDHNFMSVLDGAQRLKPDYAQPRDSGVVLKPAERWFFRISLGSHEGVLYKKID